MSDVRGEGAGRAGSPEPARALGERLGNLDACAVSDALDKLGLGSVLSGFARLSGNRRIAGRAVTVRLGVGSPPPGPVRHLGTTAIMAAQPGDVIVVEQTSGVEAGSWGGILALGAQLRGVAGVVADGPVRDADEADGYGFPIYGRSCTARTARNRIVELATNEPVTIGGISVRPGDFVLADRSAVIFVAAAEIERVLEAAEAIAAREAGIAAALRAGTPITEAMGANYEHMLDPSRKNAP